MASITFRQPTKYGTEPYAVLTVSQGQLSTSKDAISCYFLATGSGSKTCAAELNIKGRWK